MDGLCTDLWKNKQFILFPQKEEPASHSPWGSKEPDTAKVCAHTSHS